MGDLESYIRGWFLGAPLDTIQRENVEEWLTWAVLSADRQALEPVIQEEWKQDMAEYIAEIEERLDHHFDDGKNDELSCMRLTLDPVNVREI